MSLLSTIAKLPSAHHVRAATRRPLVALTSSKLVVYDVERETEIANLHVKRELGLENATHPHWSMDDRRLVVSSVGGAIAVLDTESWKVIERFGEVCARDRPARWLADGRLVYQTSSEIVVRDLDSHREHRHALPQGGLLGALLLHGVERKRWITTFTRPAKNDRTSPRVSLAMLTIDGDRMDVEERGTIEFGVRLLACDAAAERVWAHRYPEGRLELYSAKGKIEESMQCPHHRSTLAWSGDRIATYDGADITLHDARTLDALAERPMPDVNALAFCGERLVVAAGGHSGKKSSVLDCRVAT
jgi:hypothetical protein